MDDFLFFKLDLILVIQVVIVLSELHLRAHSCLRCLVGIAEKRRRRPGAV